MLDDGPEITSSPAALVVGDDDAVDIADTNGASSDADEDDDDDSE